MICAGVESEYRMRLLPRNGLEPADSVILAVPHEAFASDYGSQPDLSGAGYQRGDCARVSAGGG